tara:strand:+ start:5622 stop:6941 length:1320 start_codon:yes stop_codon:yes gene_type:complete
MSVNKQLRNNSFFKLIDAVRKIDINEVTHDTPPQEDTPEFVYSSIFDFNISDITDNVCLNNTPNDVINDIDGTLFNPLEEDIKREPSISTNLEGLSHTTRNIIKTDLYSSIRNPGVEASIQPNDTQYINSNFIKEGESINILNPQATLKLPSEFRQHLYENTKQFNQYTPYCIVYGTFTPKNKSLYHVSAAIVYNGHLYPFGWTNESVLNNPRDKTVRPLQAILVSPETINSNWNYFIIDILLITSDMLSKIESFFDNSTLKTTVDYYEPYTEGPAKGTLGIIFGENHLYVDKSRYTRVANNLTQVCFGFNCSSWIEYIFGINCRLFTLSVMPSIPNYCKRSGYQSKFKMEVLNNIIQSIRDGDFSKFFQLIDNTNKPQINKSLGGNKIKSKSKKTKKMYKKNQNSIKNRSKKRRNSAKIRSKKNGIRLKYSLKSPSKH